ncbi:AAA family ATPase [Candidatus Babeliales bacterium]|nr:AAA family ATPase [Candidatus Babeliales bacterium]MCF7899262.1 AAA family ATPase [Candidatus Babeliales bacterium]
MKRIIDFFLQEWKNEKFNRKPLLLRGARQVGKTHSIRELGKTFENFVEVNLESDLDARKIISQDFDSKRIVFQLSQFLKKDIIPGKTLLFIDEIQAVPSAIIALRYFYELIPELHVIAAGSLLDFAIEKVGMPVGRVSSLYMYPMSFLEFLVALGDKVWAKAILTHDINTHMLEPIHKKLLDLVGIYLAIGGMPAAIDAWVQTKTPRQVKRVHSDLLASYRQDFNKYASAYQIKYLDALFNNALAQLSNKFMFSRVGEYQKRELEPALELLKKAGIVHPVIRSAGQGIPIGSQAQLDDFKIIFLDVGLSQAALNLDLTSWFVEPLVAFINKGEIVESFIGQELLVYSDPIIKGDLFYWHRENRSSQAEIDYLVQIKEKVVPIKVKAGTSLRIKSMHIFLDSHPNSLYGVRFSAHNFLNEQRVFTYPLYAAARPFFDTNTNLQEALLSLVS